MLILLLEVDDRYSWLAPYAYGIVFLGILFFLFRLFENWYANTFNKPLFRHLLVYKTLSVTQKNILLKDFSFYKRLTIKEQKEFQHRVVVFLANKQFIGRQELEVTEEMKLLIAATGCMLSFGRKNFQYTLINYILIYPEEFYSKTNESYHKGEFNPREKALVLSWKDFEKGYRITDDNLNLGIHEFMHAMQLESLNGRDLDSVRFAKQFQLILKQLTNKQLREKLDETRFFRTYAFTNQYEFMAVLAEYFIESPSELKSNFPILYHYTQNLLNFKYAGY